MTRRRFFALVSAVIAAAADDRRGNPHGLTFHRDAFSLVAPPVRVVDAVTGMRLTVIDVWHSEVVVKVRA